MAKTITFATVHTAVIPTIQVSEQYCGFAACSDEDMQAVFQHNYDRLDIYQLSQLDTETAEYNEEFGDELTAEQYFERLIDAAIHNDEVVN